jgi:hypothetical protein
MMVECTADQRLVYAYTPCLLLVLQATPKANDISGLSSSGFDSNRHASVKLYAISNALAASQSQLYSSPLFIKRGKPKRLHSSNAGLHGNHVTLTHLKGRDRSVFWILDC